MKRLMALAGLLALSLSAPAAADTTDLQPYVDANVSNYTSGADYPQGSTTIGGITFDLASFDGGTGVIQLNASESHVITIDETGVNVVYLIINSAWGAYGANNGTLTFTDSALNQLGVDLVQGTNIRDHYMLAGFNTVATEVYATGSYPGGNIFDVYRYDLSGLNGTLASITFASTSAQHPDGAPFLAAITTAFEATSAVPEPATWAMMLIGFGAVGFAMRRRRKVVPALPQAA